VGVSHTAWPDHPELVRDAGDAGHPAPKVDEDGLMNDQVKYFDPRDVMNPGWRDT
jgi:hypothetical protein